MGNLSSCQNTAVHHCGGCFPWQRCQLCYFDCAPPACDAGREIYACDTPRDGVGLLIFIVIVIFILVFAALLVFLCRRKRRYVPVSPSAMSLKGCFCPRCGTAQLSPVHAHFFRCSNRACGENLAANAAVRDVHRSRTHLAGLRTGSHAGQSGTRTRTRTQAGAGTGAGTQARPREGVEGTTEHARSRSRSGAAAAAGAEGASRGRSSGRDRDRERESTAAAASLASRRASTRGDGGASRTGRANPRSATRAGEYERFRDMELPVYEETGISLAHTQWDLYHGPSAAAAAAEAAAAVSARAARAAAAGREKVGSSAGVGGTSRASLLLLTRPANAAATVPDSSLSSDDHAPSHAHPHGHRLGNDGGFALSERALAAAAAAAAAGALEEFESGAGAIDGAEGEEETVGKAKAPWQVRQQQQRRQQRQQHQQWQGIPPPLSQQSSLSHPHPYPYAPSLSHPRGPPGAAPALSFAPLSAAASFGARTAHGTSSLPSLSPLPGIVPIVGASPQPSPPAGSALGAPSLLSHTSGRERGYGYGGSYSGGGLGGVFTGGHGRAQPEYGEIRLEPSIPAAVDDNDDVPDSSSSVTGSVNALFGGGFTGPAELVWDDEGGASLLLANDAAEVTVPIVPRDAGARGRYSPVAADADVLLRSASASAAASGTALVDARSRRRNDGDASSSDWSSSSYDDDEDEDRGGEGDSSHSDSGHGGGWGWGARDSRAGARTRTRTGTRVNDSGDSFSDDDDGGDESARGRGRGRARGGLEEDDCAEGDPGEDEVFKPSATAFSGGPLEALYASRASTLGFAAPKR